MDEKELSDRVKALLDLAANDQADEQAFMQIWIEANEAIVRKEFSIELFFAELCTGR